MDQQQQQSVEKKNRRNFSFAILRRPFLKGPPRPNEDRTTAIATLHQYTTTTTDNKTTNSHEDLSSRNRSQRIFRSIKKKLKQNKIFRTNKHVVTTPPVPPPRLDLNNRLEEDESPSQYVEISEIESAVADSQALIPINHSLGMEYFNLANHGWYWGPISKREAEEKLKQHVDGSFLIRDSTNDRHFFTLSFRADGKTLHSRIEYARGCYSICESQDFPSIAALVAEALSVSKKSLYSYSRLHQQGHAMRLTKPVSRFTQVRSLQYLCRFVVRQYITVNNIEKLPVPPPIQGYLVQGHY